MKNSILTSLALAVFLFACNEDADKAKDAAATTDSSTIAKPADEKPAQTAAAPLDSAAMAKAMEAYMTPGEVHKMMASWNGAWESDIQMWMDPAAPPVISKSKAVNKMILGGRYQEAKHTGNMMGMPFEGVSTLAYDNGKKEFVSTWVDNMGTGIMVLKGTWDDGSKTLTLKGASYDPTTGKDCEIKETMKIVDDKHQVMEMYMTPAGGKEFKSMEIKSTKK
jgi:hypothetical protein